jgi:hypothetical protein
MRTRRGNIDKPVAEATRSLPPPRPGRLAAGSGGCRRTSCVVTGRPCPGSGSGRGRTGSGPARTEGLVRTADQPAGGPGRRRPRTSNRSGRRHATMPSVGAPFPQLRRGPSPQRHNLSDIAPRRRLSQSWVREQGSRGRFR